MPIEVLDMLSVRFDKGFKNKFYLLYHNLPNASLEEKRLGNIKFCEGLKKVVELLLMGSGYQIHHKEDECLKGTLSFSEKNRMLSPVQSNETDGKNNINILFDYLSIRP